MQQARIFRNAETQHPAYVADYLPTLLDAIGKAHPQPSWAADGMSLLPLITSLGAGGVGAPFWSISVRAAA